MTKFSDKKLSFTQVFFKTYYQKLSIFKYFYLTKNPIIYHINFFLSQTFCNVNKKEQTKTKTFLSSRKSEIRHFHLWKKFGQLPPFLTKKFFFSKFPIIFGIYQPILSIFICNLCHNTLFGKNNQKIKIRKFSTNLKK